VVLKFNWLIPCRKYFTESAKSRFRRFVTTTLRNAYHSLALRTDENFLTSMMVTSGKLLGHPYLVAKDCLSIPPEPTSTRA